MEGNSRQLVKIVKEICKEHGIAFQGFSYDWILQLTANCRTMHIYGYKFPNNNAAIEQICNDKSALSDILSAHNIPHIPHSYFISPNNKEYIPSQGNWDKMQALLQQYGKVVCKPNTGTGGHSVFKVSSQRDLEFATHEIFSKSRALSISPYRVIQAEYRIIIVNSNVGVIYEKKRPFVIGNGLDSIKHLIEKDAALGWPAYMGHSGLFLIVSFIVADGNSALKTRISNSLISKSVTKHCRFRFRVLPSTVLYFAQLTYSVLTSRNRTCQTEEENSTLFCMFWTEWVHKSGRNARRVRFQYFTTFVEIDWWILLIVFTQTL